MIPLSVFVVHPDPGIAARIARAIAVAGHAPVLLADGERAIDRFVQEPADVVVVDFFLPGRDGVATIESIRWAPGGREALVVLLADREPDIAPLETLGARVGAIATVLGPFDDPAIARIVGALAPPDTDDTTRVATAREIDVQLERLGMSTDALDRRKLERARRGVERDDEAWPLVETVMSHASGAQDESGSGVLRRPEAPLDDAAPHDQRLTTPPPAMRPEELTPEPIDADGGPIADPAELEEGRDVGENARAAAEGSHVVMGRFEETTFPSLLRRLADLRAHGALVCVGEGLRRDTTTGDAPTKLVYFRAGVPIHVRSNLLDECLGQILLRRRRIGAATLEESIRRMRLGEGLQGEILIDMGALAPLELGEALAEQSRDKLFDLFGWTRGTYRLSSKLEPPARAVGIELCLAEIVYEGVCAAMPATRLFQLLSPHLARYVVPDPVQLARFARVRLVPEVRQVLGRVTGMLTLREVLSMGTRPGAVAQLVYAMECLGAVRYADQPARTIRSGESPALLSSAEALASSAEELASSAEELTSSAEELASDSSARATQPGTPHSGELAKSALIAGDEDEEETEPSSSDEASLELLAPTGEREAPSPVDDGADDAPESDPAEPALLDAPDAMDEDAWEDATAPTRGRAGVARNDASGMHATPEHDERRESAPMPAPSLPLDSLDSLEAPPAGIDARVDDLFEAERHFRRGNRALDRGRLTEALAAFERAYELCPDQGEFLAYVGWARHCLSPDDPLALEEALGDLAEARELSPELHVTHLLHARVLASAGRAEEAHGAYLRVLQLDPECAEARDALGAGLF